MLIQDSVHRQFNNIADKIFIVNMQSDLSGTYSSNACVRGALHTRHCIMFCYNRGLSFLPLPKALITFYLFCVSYRFGKLPVSIVPISIETFMITLY